MDTKEIKVMALNLEKAQRDKLPASHINDILNKLKSDVVATEPLLRETKIGMTVNKLRAHADTSISNLAREIVNKWKNDVGKTKSKPNAGASADTPKNTTNATKKEASPNNNGTSSSPTMKKETVSANNSRKPTVPPKDRKKETDGVSWELYDDEVRNKTLGLFYDSLCVHSEEAPDHIMLITKAVEQAVYKTNGSKTDGSYRTKVRSLFLNLKDPKNPNLRKRVVSKEISAERVATMSSEEMASSELKQELRKIENENMKNSMTPKGEKATTDQFQCGKCKQRKVSYSQAQTRSADEPMTTFCECEMCGHRWKFS